MTQQMSADTLAMPRGSFVTRHWRGDLSVGRSYWINGVLIGILVFALSSGVVAGLSVGVTDRTVLVAALLVLIIVTFAITLWQFVGIWRSAGRHVGRGGKRTWAILARIAVVVGGLFALAFLVNNLNVLMTIASDDRYWLDPTLRRRL
jgi:hypothetical protein